MDAESKTVVKYKKVAEISTFWVLEKMDALLWVLNLAIKPHEKIFLKPVDDTVFVYAAQDIKEWAELVKKYLYHNRSFKAGFPVMEWMERISAPKDDVELFYFGEDSHLTDNFSTFSTYKPGAGFETRKSLFDYLDREIIEKRDLYFSKNVLCRLFGEVGDSFDCVVEMNKLRHLLEVEEVMRTKSWRTRDHVSSFGFYNNCRLLNIHNPLTGEPLSERMMKEIGGEIETYESYGFKTHYVVSDDRESHVLLQQMINLIFTAQNEEKGLINENS